MTTGKKSLGSTLREIRGMRKLSLRDVEDATGISNAYLSQLENEKIAKPSPHYLHKLAKLYGVDYEMLMEAAGYVHGRTERPGPKTLLGAALFTDGELTPEEAEQLAVYLRFLRSQRK